MTHLKVNWRNSKPSDSKCCVNGSSIRLQQAKSMLSCLPLSRLLTTVELSG